MSVVGGDGSYISDAAIMSWLATQQGRIYDDLRESMDLSQQRANFTDELNTIKADIQEANEKEDFKKVDEELKRFLDTYGDDPHFSSICADLRDMADSIAGGRALQTRYDDDYAAYRSADAAYSEIERHSQWEGGVGAMPARPQAPTKPAPQQYSDEMLKSWADLIGGKIDGLAKNDQLTMIHIQELKATLDQGAQLGSSFISSGDKTSSAIINNIA